MKPLLLDEKVMALDAALQAASVAHAFGGALALAYYATPRGTVDIDVNVFASTDEAERVFAALTPLGVATAGPAQRKRLREQGQIRLNWDGTPVDLFFSYDPLHESCLARTCKVPFGEGAVLPVLSAEDLVVFKVLFDRPKDWRDINEVLFSLGGEFDAAYARGWLQRILDRGDARLTRFEEQL